MSLSSEHRMAICEKIAKMYLDSMSTKDLERYFFDTQVECLSEYSDEEHCDATLRRNLPLCALGKHNDRRRQGLVTLPGPIRRIRLRQGSMQWGNYRGVHGCSMRSSPVGPVPTLLVMTAPFFPFATATTRITWLRKGITWKVPSRSFAKSVTTYARKTACVAPREKVGRRLPHLNQGNLAYLRIL